MPLELLKKIQRFRNDASEQKDLFAALSQGQSPYVMIITCADSRIALNAWNQEGLGELFIIRNAGNIIAPMPLESASSSEAGSIEFAVTDVESKGLGVREIIVCGHSHCGAMKGLMTPNLEETLPQTAAWISHSRSLIEKLHQRHPEINDNPSLALMHLTQDNVLLQIENLKTHTAVKEQLKAGKLKIHGWYYELETGEFFIYSPSKEKFLSFEQTVDDIAEDSLRSIVADEALNYLTSISASKTVEKFKYIQSLINQMKQDDNVSCIWAKIKTKVTVKLHDQIGALYATSDLGISPRFDALLRQAPSISIANLSTLHKVFTQLPTVAHNRYSLHQPGAAEAKNCTNFLRAHM